MPTRALYRTRRSDLSTVGRLADTGFHIGRDGWPPHLSVRFPVSPTDADLEVLTDAFDPAMANPLAAGVS
ncbi:hypothetical protein BH18ACT15_BH18ACT15_15380 [soil metagenome]